MTHTQVELSNQDFHSIWKCFLPGTGNWQIVSLSHIHTHNAHLISNKQLYMFHISSRHLTHPDKVVCCGCGCDRERQTSAVWLCMNQLSFHNPAFTKASYTVHNTLQNPYTTHTHKHTFNIVFPHLQFLSHLDGTLMALRVTNIHIEWIEQTTIGNKFPYYSFILSLHLHLASHYLSLYAYENWGTERTHGRRAE